MSIRHDTGAGAGYAPGAAGKKRTRLGLVGFWFLVREIEEEEESMRERERDRITNLSQLPEKKIGEGHRLTKKKKKEDRVRLVLLR